MIVPNISQKPDKKGAAIAPEELPKRWEAARIVRVGDASLSSGVRALWDYHMARRLYEGRLHGMELHQNVDSEGVLEVQRRPHVFIESRVLGRTQSASRCVFCEPPVPEIRGLAWRGWVCWPNMFPYAGPQSEHIIIASAARTTQTTFDSSILSDMIQIRSALSARGPVTLHFNGIAGNSQNHLHWQATRESLPLARLLCDPSVESTTVVRRPAGTVDTYDNGWLSGFVLRGTRSFTCRWACELVRRLREDPETDGHFNCLLLPSETSEVRMAIIPRRPGSGTVEIEGMGTVPVASFAVGGRLLLTDQPFDPRLTDRIKLAMSKAIVAPWELSWSRRLNEAGGPTTRWRRLQLEAMGHAARVA